MAEYIDKQAFVDSIREAVRKYPNTFYNGLEVARQIAHDMDAADVQPVRHGRWEQKEVFEAKDCVDELQSAFCPVCQRYHTTPYSYYFSHYNYCPNCGAKMDGERKEGEG